MPSPISILLRSIRETWREQVYLHERLLEANRPWEQAGPLRWRYELGGRRLVGRHLPIDEELRFRGRT